MSKLKPDIIENEVRTTGFKKIQEDILQTTKRVDEYNDSIKKLVAQKNRLTAAGKQESDEFKNTVSEIDKLKDARAQEVKSYDKLIKSLNLSEMSYNQIKKRATELARELRKTSKAADPERYAELEAQHRRMTDQMAKMNKGLREVSKEVEKVPSVWNNAFSKIKEFGPAVAIGRGIGYVSGKMRQFISGSVNDFRTYDEALTDAMKTTGLSKDEIKGVSDELRNIDTRTTQDDLLALARVAGKLGKETPQDIEAFVRAADVISVALSEDLGGNVETAINEIGKLVDIFGLEQEYGIEDAMIRVGSAINAAGAASTANEGYIVDFSKRVAGVAPNAKISIQNIVGLAATLDKFGQVSEASSTVISQTISKMFTDPAKHAKMAGMEVNAFIDLLNTDTNAALIALIKGVQGSDSEMMSIANNLDDISVRGARGKEVLGALAKNIEQLEIQQALANKAFTEGNSVLDEYNTKNNSAEAQAEKLKKQFTEQSVILGEKLAPVVNSASTGLLYFTKAMVAVIGYLIESKGVIIAITSTIIAYNVQKKLSAFYSKANGVAILSEAAAMKAGTASAATYTIGQKALVAVKALLVGQFKAVGIAAKSAGVAVKSFFVALGPIGWAITAIGAIATAMSFLKSETKKTAGAFSEMALHISSEKQSYEALRKQLYQTKEGTAERANLIKVVNDHYKEYLPNLLTEKSTTKEIATALDDATGALRRNIQAKTAAAEIEKAEQALYDAKKGAMESLIEVYGNYNTAATDTERALVMMQLGGAINYISEYVATAEDAVGTTGRVLQAMGYYITETNEFGQQIVGSYKKPQQSLSRDAGKATADVIAATLQYRAAIAMVQTLTAPYAPGKAPAGDAGDGGGGGGDTTCKKCGKKPCQCDKDDTKAKQKWTLDNDKTFAEKRTALKKQLLDGQIATDEQYSRQMLDLEIATLEARIASGKAKGEDLLRLKEQLLDKQLQKSKDAKRREDDLLKTAQGGHSDLQKAQREFDDKLKALDLHNKAVADMTDSEHKAYLALEQEFVKKKASITLKHLSDQFALLKKSNDRELADQQIKHNNEFASLSTFAKKKEFLQNKISDKQHASIRTSAQADKAIKAYYATQEANTQRRHLESMISSYREMLAQYKSTGNVADQILSAEDQQALNDRIKQLELELSKLLATASGTETPSTPEQGGKKGGGVDVLGMAPEDWEKMFQNLGTASDGLSAWGAVIGAVGNAMASAFSDISNLMTAIEQRELAAYEKNQNAKKKALDKQLKSGQISQERYNEKIQQLDEQTEAKRIEIERKQAERQKMLAIFQALINTAVAITSAIAQGGPIAGPILAGIIGALGAVQIATIAAQPLPGAEVGGMLVERTQDGKHYNALYEPQRRGTVSRPTVLVGENGTEYVVPADGYANPTIRPVLDLIEQARQSGSLRSINLPALIAANSATPMAGRSAGGYVSSTQPTNSAAVEPRTSLADTEILTRLTEILDSLDNKLPLIKAIISENGRDGLGEALDRRDKLINRSKL